MASRAFKKTLSIRFTAYLFILIGVLAILFEFGPVAQTEVAFRKDTLFGIKHTLAPTIVNSGGQVQLVPQTAGSSASFGDLASLGSNQITPLDTNYSIVIEKINANSKVIPDIDPANTDQYEQALAVGVAATVGSTAPGQPGNLYIFSHSVDAPWNVIRYNAVFYLLREMEAGDKVVLFYQNKRYDYEVFDKQIVDPSDTTLLTNRYNKPVLTLQTCDPPGTLLHRLIVRAKLVGS